jgi:5-methylcytosine-specific restriction endonuclease McrA
VRAFSQVLLLNASFEPLNVINWKRALKLVFLEKAEVLQENEKEIRSITISMRIPSVVRLLRYVGFRRRDVRFSRQNIYARDRFSCQYCGRKLRSQELTCDHVTPRSRGGRTEWTNIVTCCIPCNRRKGGKTPREVGLRLIRKPSRPSWLLGFHARFSIHEPPPSWQEYLYGTLKVAE